EKRNDAAASENTRSCSGSKKLPVEVLTGSLAKPEVGCLPTAENGSIVRVSRCESTPALARAAAIDASDIVRRPSPPAASNASATGPAHSASPALSSNHEFIAVKTG